MKEILLQIVQNPILHARWLNTLSYLEFLGARKIARSALPENQNEMRLRHLAEEARHAHFFKRMIARLSDAPSQESSFVQAQTQEDTKDCIKVSLQKIQSNYEPQNLFCGGAALRYFHGLDALARDSLFEARQKPKTLLSSLRENEARHSTKTSKTGHTKDCKKSKAFRDRALSKKESELCYLYVTLLVEERAGSVYPVYDAILQEKNIPIRLSGVLAEEERHLSDMEAALSKHPLHEESLLSSLRDKESILFVRFEKRMSQDLALRRAA